MTAQSAAFQQLGGCPGTDAPCSYPLPVPATPDPRFSPDLINAVADLLQDKGFPLVYDGGDLQALGGALFAFLYRPAATR